MSHISELTLFDYVSGKAGLTTEEIEHLSECDDCQQDLIEVECVAQDSPDLEKARQLLAEDGR
jgi:hypothetical protein